MKDFIEQLGVFVDKFCGPGLGGNLSGQASGLVLLCSLLTGLGRPFSGQHLQNNGVGVVTLGGGSLPLPAYMNLLIAHICFEVVK